MDVNLWFAKDEQSKIIGIYDAIKEEKYRCPICNSEVIPKALESKKITPHFAHLDRDKCNSESLLHWWFKNKFIDKEDEFTIITDKEIKYKCKDFRTEITFDLESGKYKPDLLVETYQGDDIVFEMANTNKKQVKDYIDKWIELDKIVVEVDIKHLTNNVGNTIKKFNALYYKGKCFNFNKRDGGYYKTITTLKERMDNSYYNIEFIRKFNWFWDELLRNTTKGDNDEVFFEVCDTIEEKDMNEIGKILGKNKCSKSIYKYIDYKADKLKNEVTSDLEIELLEIFNTDVKIMSEYSNWHNCKKVVTRIFKKEENSWYVGDYTKKEIIDILKINLEYRKQEEVYHQFDRYMKEQLELIKTNKEIINLINKLEEPYELSIWHYGRYKRIKHNECETLENLKKLANIDISLNYDRRTALSYTFSLEEYTIDSIISNIITKIKLYFSNLDKIDSRTIENLNILKDQLINTFSYTNVKINSEIYLEDVICVYIKEKYYLSSFYFSNKGFILNWRDYNSVINWNSIENIKTTIETDIIDSLKKEHTYNCKDCEENFVVEIGEIKFFNKNNFSLPKRCKRCRTKNKKK